MIPRAQRLTRADFSQRPLRRISFPFGSIHVLPGAPSAAVVVSKKITPSAVRRNKLRRRIYAMLRPALSESRLHHAVVVYPNKKAATTTFSVLETELLRALRDC